MTDTSTTATVPPAEVKLCQLILKMDQSRLTGYIQTQITPIVVTADLGPFLFWKDADHNNKEPKPGITKGFRRAWLLDKNARPIRLEGYSMTFLKKVFRPL